MAGQVHIADCQASSVAALSTKQGDNFRHTAAAEREPLGTNALDPRDFTAEASTPEVIAHGLEFVALPGKAEKLPTVLPEAMSNAIGDCGSFSGCLVLVSVQEARLVTVITLWTGKDRARQCNENSKRVKRLLMPYVDRLLRTRKLAAFLSTRSAFSPKDRS